MFGFVEDYHRQQDGVVEADAARIDDMLERLGMCPTNFDHGWKSIGECAQKLRQTYLLNM